MDDELVLLTSYFNLADGRRQNNAPTFRVDADVQSATAPDGSAALYIVTESSAGGNVGPRARKLAADTIAWEYATHGDEPPAVRLKAALRTAHEEVRRELDGHVTVGVSVMAVEGDTVYLGQVPPAQVYVLHEGSLHSIPASGPGDSPFSRALGSTGAPQILVFRDQIAAGDVVALCSSWFHNAIDSGEVKECFSAGTVDEITDAMLDLARENEGRDITAIVVEAVPASELEAAEDGETPPGLVEQVDSAVQALATVGRFLWTELQVGAPAGRAGAPSNSTLRSAAPSEATEPAGPASDSAWSRSLDASTAVLDNPSAPAGVEPVPLEAPATEYPSDTWPDRDFGATPADGKTHEIPIVMPEPAVGPAVSETAAEAPPPKSGRRNAPPPEITTEQPAFEPDVTAVPLSEMEQVNSRLDEGPDMAEVIPPVQAFPDMSTQPERIYATSKDIEKVNRRPRRFGGIARPAARDVSSGPPIIRPPLVDLDLSRPASRPAPPAALWLGMAAVFILAAAALFLYLKHRHAPPVANPYPGLVRTDLKLATRAKTSVNQDYYLARATHNLAVATTSGTPALTIHTLKRQLRSTSDLLHHITRVQNPLVVSTFGTFPKAVPAQIAVAPGLVFVLDSGRNSVFSISLNATSGPTTIVQSGELDSGYTIGTPVLLASDPSTSTALVLDDHNTLVRDASGTKTATVLTQQTQNEKIAAMATASPDVYTLDTAGSQVWRYPYGISGFNPTAQGFFGSNGPNLTHAISFALDGTSLFILRSGGAILKYDMQANPLKFQPRLRTPLQNPTAIYTSAGLNYLWVADPSHGRIVQLDTSGNYVRTYQSGTHIMNLHAIKSIAVGPAGNTLYVLSGSTIYDFSLVH